MFSTNIVKTQYYKKGQREHCSACERQTIVPTDKNEVNFPGTTKKKGGKAIETTARSTTKENLTRQWDRADTVARKKNIVPIVEENLLKLTV
jgi:hypothetical protein